ncbi:MAG: 4Fe-4S binding protein [Alphaproteobacteria bacterium]|nr:4Fe-4S binding protein [Alphaproteobacteria bacterium]
MKNKILIFFKFLVELAVLALAFLAFYKKIYPLKIFDLQFVAMLQSGVVTGAFVSILLFVSILALTFVFGRVYCSVLCPLGIFQEILTLLFKPFYKKMKTKKISHSFMAYVLTVVLFGTFFGGTVALLRLFDPYSVFGNFLSGAGFGIGFMAFLAVLVLFKKRFFCVNICPVGQVLGLVSKKAVFQLKIEKDKCKMCGLCTKVCPSGSIDFKNQKIDNETCVRCLKCLPHCRHGAIVFSTKKEEPSFDFSRRNFIKAGALLVLFGTMAKTGAQISKNIGSKIKNVILPAGAKNVKDFANRCLNCNLCVENCPMKIIKKANKETPFVHLEYGANFCKYKCHKCSKVCPSGAIEKISLSEKQKTKIATAVVDEQKCIQCGMCVYECPREIIIKNEGQAPIIRFDECIGCGACHAVCPVQAISMEPVDVQTKL